ncbi:MAG: bifunctional [glutamine synthetase] adenylyltransferase/[glutamine synthetase]-adenylyl-L-tyrosine phosphorylase [Bifidobacterium minimum]|nr:bifunctional [glutamine synthetase] adenylyltransferase/[glutamine synthetase]-adenylyl-L-tyrosine phosphorylase [Bifidobacterium minimum]
MPDPSSPSIGTRDLLRAGFRHPGDAQDALRHLCDRADGHLTLPGLLRVLSRTCDPDMALDRFTAMMESPRTNSCLTDASASEIEGLFRVLGASVAMGMLMATRPELVRSCLEASRDPSPSSRASPSSRSDGESRRRALMDSVDADPASQAPVSRCDLGPATQRLRAEYHRQLAAIMAQDLLSDDPAAVQPLISHDLSDLADATLDAALAIARHVTDESSLCRFAVIGMGKLGARELNYVSDVDLIYVVEPTHDDDADIQRVLRTGARIALTLQRVCQSIIPGVDEPALWQIDTALRPEGKDGPLVRRLDSHLDYYRKWADSWEFQALLKARCVAGDRALGDGYVERTRPLVWSASMRPNFVNDCQAMRRRVENLIPDDLKDREIKLGRGGLRDVEFTVQMLQLVHGRADESLRVPDTMSALRALAEGGYVSRRQARQLSDDYRFERVLEHRQQMWMLKRTHLFPDLGPGNRGGLDRKRNVTDDQLNHNDDLRRLSRALGLLPEHLLERFDHTRREVRHLHMEIYYRPMLPISAQTDSDAFALSEDAAHDRLRSIGFEDPAAAMRHMDALTMGLSRAAKINRILLPAVLEWLGQGQNPDMGLLNWRRLAEHFGSEDEYLGFLRDSPSAAQRLCHILADSRFLGDALNKSAESITWLGSDSLLRPRSRESLDVQCHAAIDRSPDDPADVALSLRMMRRREIERIGLAWIGGVMSDEDCLTALTDVTDSIIDSALIWASRNASRPTGVDLASVSVIGMGRYGGRELNFSSDADAIIIYRPAAGVDDADAARYARTVADDLRTILQGSATTEPKIDLDLSLRPEGRNGPVVRSLASCAEYYSSWSSIWEHQALIRARHAGGDRDLSREFLENVADPLRFPREPPHDEGIAEIRRLKARMEGERLPRGVRRDRHLKLGLGGLSDVEWTVQLLQLLHAGHEPTLRTGSTLTALHALTDLGLVDGSDADILANAWRLCTAARNANYLWTGRATQADILPDDRYSLAGVAVCMGYPPHHGQQFDNDVMSAMRRCRDVTKRLFYAADGR